MLVAYSGGVDSSLLLALAHEVLAEKAVAATAVAEIFSGRERDAAVQFARQRGITHILVESDPMRVPAFVSNKADRCYHCKRYLCQALIHVARQRGIDYVAHGANVDDLTDYRPGLQAAKEMGVVSPLVDAGLKKEDVRFLAKEMGLVMWDKPTMACLATRIPYGDPITRESLQMIDEAETFLLERGLRQCRVRHHGPLARIEVEGEALKVIMEDNLRKAVVERFKEIGFVSVALDLEGYTSGSMNRMLDNVKS